MNTLDKQYQELLFDIIERGVDKDTRNGKTRSIFGYTIRHNMKDGFPLLTTKKMAWKTMVTELLWFLRGDTNIKYLVDNGCNIWNGDAYKNYLKWVGNNPLTIEEFIEKIKNDSDFASVYGELGPIYGKQWRNWGYDSDKWSEEYKKLQFGSKEEIEHLGKKGIDQISNLIHDLKTNPDSRRLMVNAWNVGELDQMILPPCHYGFQVYTRELSLEERVEIYGVEKIQTNNAGWYECSLAELDVNQANIPKRAISLMFNMRSTDVGLGLSFNLSSYGLLLMMIAKQVNMVPDELIYNGGDVHLYLNHIEPIKEQLTREPYELPTVKISDRVVNDISEYTLDDITLENYQSHPSIKMPLSN